MIRELLEDMIKYLPSYIVPAIVGIMAVPIITRLFPPQDYGNYILVLTTVSILSAIASAWLSASVIRFFPVYKLSGQVEELYSTVIKLTIVSLVAISLTSLGILFFAQDHISANLYSLMRIGVLVFIVTSFSQVLLDTLRIKRKVIWYSSITIWRSIAGLGLGVALIIFFQYGVDGLLWGSFLSMAIVLPLLCKVAVGQPSFKNGSIYSQMTSEMAKYGFPVIPVNIASWVLSLSDRYIIEFYRGSAEVGLYSISYAISEQTMLMIVSLFMVAAAPIEYTIWENRGKEASREFLSRLTRYYLLIGLPAAVGLSVLAKPIISILAASAYFPGYRIVPLVVFGVFLVGITHRFSEALAFYKRSDILMYCIVGAAFLKIGLNFIFIPKYGYMAAAITTLIAFGADLTARVILSRRFFVWEFPFKSLAKITFASAVMGIVIYPMSNSLTTSTLINLIAGICVGVIVYVVMLFLLREPQKEETQELYALLLGGKNEVSHLQ